MKIENNILKPIKENTFLHEIKDIGGLENGLYYPPDLKKGVYFAINYTPDLDKLKEEYEVMTLEEFTSKREEWIAILEAQQKEEE